MEKKRLLVVCLTGMVFMFSTVIAFSEEAATIQLPSPQMDGGKPLMQALKERKSVRAFAPDPIPPQTLSNLLWAAFVAGVATRTEPDCVIPKEPILLTEGSKSRNLPRSELFDAHGYGAVSCAYTALVT